MKSRLTFISAFSIMVTVTMMKTAVAKISIDIIKDISNACMEMVKWRLELWYN